MQYRGVEDTTVPAMVKAGPLALKVDPAAIMLSEDRVMAWLSTVNTEVGAIGG